MPYLQLTTSLTCAPFAVDITVTRNSEQDHSYELTVQVHTSNVTQLEQTHVSSKLSVDDLTFTGGGSAILLNLLSPYIKTSLKDALNSKVESESSKLVKKAAKALLGPPYSALLCGVNNSATNVYCDSNVVGIKRDVRLGPVVPLPDPAADQVASRHAAVLLDFEGLNGLLDIVRTATACLLMTSNFGLTVTLSLRRWLALCEAFCHHIALSLSVGHCH